MGFTLLDKDTVLDLHARQIERHGGLGGIRDEGLLESALGRAENLLYYGGDQVALHHVAASLAFGIAKNHPFFDGNKRTSLVVAVTTLAANGRRLHASKPDVLKLWQDLAAGAVTEDALAMWIQANSQPSAR